jgi:uncharacterized protein YPO0396
MKDVGQQPFLDGETDQFRLARIQTYNWGTFSNVFDFAIPKKGYLFVGPSGSGKSTILDAHAALMTPPVWLDFNTAARESERRGRDRNILTYVRGAWAQQTGDGGEYVSLFLRTGTTWSAVSETYRNEQGRVVVLVLVLWIKGNASAPTDVRRLYLTLEREFEVQELEFFAEHQFDTRRFKLDLEDAKAHPDFSGYQERFRRLLGIDNERALRLLHKTQSAKNLGDLNVFLRDFMLDEPETFEIASNLVNEFGELNSAHQEVVSARKQIAVLKPAREQHLQLQSKSLEHGQVLSLQSALDHYREHCRRRLLQERLEELKIDQEASRQESLRLQVLVEQELDKLLDLQREKVNLGSGVLDKLAQEIAQGEAQLPDRVRRRDQAAAACQAMGWAMPESVVWFVQRVEAARQRVLTASQANVELEDRKDKVKERKRSLEAKFEAAVSEVRALESQRSNLPARLLQLRQQMASALSLSEDTLPFAGELLEVRDDASEWQGAIERVLGGLSKAILVVDRHYPAVSAYLNDRHIGERLVYFRTLPQASGNTSMSPSSLIRKLRFAEGAFSDWLKDEIKTHYNVECAENLQAFRNAPRAVTRQGQVKSRLRHEKDDRYSVNDRSRWVLGFDNKAKLELFKEEARTLGAQLAEVNTQLSVLAEEERSQQGQLLHCQTLSNLTWNDVDVPSLAHHIADLQKRLDEERRVRPDLAALEARISAQEEVHRLAGDKTNREDSRGHGIEAEQSKFNGKLEETERLWPGSDKPPPFVEQLQARFDATGRYITLESLDQATTSVERALGADLRAIDVKRTELNGCIVQCFVDFNREWPDVAGGLDASMHSADDYFAKLHRLEVDNLPKYEERFFSMLREQSDQNLTLLATKLEQERSAIKARMELVNESLEDAPFNPGTHLVIETKDKDLEEVKAFRVSLKGSLSHTLSDDRQLAEERFKALAALVKRLASHETVDKNWRGLVLDVRQHVEFVAREFDEAGVEVDVYRSGAGKSGGQRQKLAATCLAAALRYQLGGEDRSLPSYATVVLDEAFDKADAEFTALAMNIFRTFGFQMIVATPLKSVMTLEPFIGGACFVHIKDRKRSTVLLIEYDHETERLKLPAVAHDAQETAVS